MAFQQRGGQIGNLAADTRFVFLQPLDRRGTDDVRKRIERPAAGKRIAHAFRPCFRIRALPTDTAEFGRNITELAGSERFALPGRQEIG